MECVEYIMCVTCCYSVFVVKNLGIEEILNIYNYNIILFLLNYV